MIDILSGIQNFAVSVGTEVLKEKGMAVYNENKIKSELTDYVSREFVNYENIDRNCEIDFEGLRIYVTEKLIGDFRLSLYGNLKEREQKKESLLTSLCAYVCADTTEKKQYVQKVFSAVYDIIKNFYEIYMIKTEDIYLANKIVDDIHKDIKENIKFSSSLQGEVSYASGQQPAVSMVQYGDKNQQIGQAADITIINN